MKNRLYLVALFLVHSLLTIAQTKEMKVNLNESGTHFIKATFLNQVWLRFNESNPGTMVLGKEAPQTFDIGLRRTRMQLYGRISDRMFFYTQFGMNNFNYLSQNAGNRKLQAFFHDALGEYIIHEGKNTMKAGAGLTICNGLSRFSQPSIGTILTLDVPVFAQATVDQTDEFSRKLSVYLRGQWGKLDYRLILSDPFPITTSGGAVPSLGADANFTPVGHHHQYQAYLSYNFLDRESHVTPYMTGTYLGKKKIFNLEGGAISQKNATWSSNGTDTAFHNMLLWSVAAFLDLPLNSEKGTAISAYAGYFNTDYGPNYTRNNGPMNPGQSVNANGTFNGTGSAYPMFGTGSVVYAQAGYLMRKDLLGSLGTLLPYASVQTGILQKLNDPVVVLDAGLNWLIDGHAQKLTLGWQQRPVFDAINHNSVSRKNMVMMQYQVNF